jgi:putative flavoprotein involved in K+ transport
VEALRGWTALLRADLGESLAAADEFAGRVLQRIDDHVRASGLEAPEEPLGESGSPFSTGDVGELDLQAAGIKAVVWANGYRPDFSWIGLPIFDAEGWPVQARGVTAAPGLYFVGLHWLHKRKSALLLGVGEDAEYVVSHIVGG